VRPFVEVGSRGVSLVTPTLPSEMARLGNRDSISLTESVRVVRRRRTAVCDGRCPVPYARPVERVERLSVGAEENPPVPTRRLFHASVLMRSGWSANRVSGRANKTGERIPLRRSSADLEKAVIVERGRADFRATLD
jgi:hypothetical protein